MLKGINLFHPEPPLNVAFLPAVVAGYFSVPVAIPASKLFTLRNVCISWHAVVFRNLRIFLPSLAIIHWKKHYTDSYLLKQWGRLVMPDPAVAHSLALVHDQWTRTNYYHWMVDSLSRLLVLRAHHPDSILVMLEPSASYVQQTARLLGFNNFIYLAEGEVLRAPRLLVPAHIAPPGLHNPVLLRNIKTEIIAGLQLKESKPTRRIYASRARQKVRRLQNESALLEMVAKLGFETVYFEELTMEQQVQLMQETAVLMGVHGANLVNLLFLPESSCVVELFNEDKFLRLGNTNFENLIYYRMSTSLNLGYIGIPCETVLGQQPSNDADISVNLDYMTQMLTQILPG